MMGLAQLQRPLGRLGRQNAALLVAPKVELALL